MNRFVVCSSLASVALIGSLAVAAKPNAVTFDEAPKQWKASIGGWEVQEGVLVGRELTEDHHPAAGRLLFPFNDGTIRGRFQNIDARAVNVGFDPAPKELTKKGHLCAITITGKQANLSMAPDKAKPGDKAMALAKADIGAASDSWTEFEITFSGDTITAKVGNAVLTGTHPDLACQKTGIVLRVMGGSAHFDDITWETR